MLVSCGWRLRWKTFQRKHKDTKSGQQIVEGKGSSQACNFRLIRPISSLHVC